MSNFGAPLEPANDEAGVIAPDAKVGNPKAVEWWEAEGVPEGAHSQSLYYVDDSGAKHFAGPTHFLHLADGRVVAGYGGGTHYAEGDKVMAIIGTHAG